jgi:hypothetical protein
VAEFCVIDAKPKVFRPVGGGVPEDYFYMSS